MTDLSENINENVQQTECCCRKLDRERDRDEVRDLIVRLNRIEGQIRGIRKMLEDGIYCTDIITQVSAVSAALNSFNRVLIADHIKTCVTDDILGGNTEKTDELIALLQKLMK